METPQSLRADARRNYEALVRVARKHLRNRGVSTSLEAIAREAGVGVGTLYRHFPTREHLLCEVLHERQEVLLTRRDEASAMPCAQHALRAWMQALKDYLCAFSGLPQPFIDAFEAQASRLAHSKSVGFMIGPWSVQSAMSVVE